MRPEPPANYRESWLERVGLKRLLSQTTRMVLRNVQRRPLRAAISSVGIAFAVALLVVGTFFLDSINTLLDIQFQVVERQDVSVTFNEPVSGSALFEVAHWPGVLQVEPTRVVAARLRFGHRSRLASLQGLSGGAVMRRVVDGSLREIELPRHGVVMSQKLGDLLGAQTGDEITVQVLEGERPVRRVRIARLVQDYLGMSVYMEVGALRRMMREGETLSGAFFRIDGNALDRFYREVKNIPAVAEVLLKRSMIESFQDTIQQNLGIMIFFNALFGSVIAFGVVYNAARISLSERSRELASLRVLGFTRAEISTILLGELAALTAVGIPLGMLMGYGLCVFTASVWETDLYRFPLTVTTRTYAYSAMIVALASLLSGLLVRRKLDRLDLIAVLKSRE